MSTDDKAAVSRRQMVGTTGIGIAAAAAAMAPAPAQAAPAAQLLQDPAGKYPRPPFKPQSQPWPGLAWPARWSRGRTMAKPVTVGRAAWPGARR